MRIINTAEFTSESDLSRLSDNDRESMYNGLDCCVTYELLEILLEELDEVSAKTYQLSLDLRAPILEMSMRGIRVDLAKRDAVLVDFQYQHKFVAAHLERIFIEVFGTAYNYRSVRDMKELFYDVLGCKPIRKRNANGQFVPTVNRDAIEKLAINYWAAPLCSHIIALRELDKKIAFLKTGIDPDGRMRTSFNIAGTNSGRLASSMSEFGTGTNMQNIDRSLRSIFIPDPGKKFINIDLEQGDSRNMGAVMWQVFYASHGPAFAGSYLDACESGDLHTAVARMTWTNLAWPDDDDLAAAKIVAEQIYYRLDSYRQTAKKLGHGTNYKGTPRTMALHTKMPVSIISAFQISYFRAFPVIPEYHKWIEQQVKDYACLTTLFGRRRYFFGRANDPKTINEAVAYPSQSMTADEVNIATIRLWRDERIELLCQVHDSLLMQVETALADDIVPELLTAARAPLLLAGDREFVVPNDAKVGWNWGDYNKKDPDENPNGLMSWSASGDSRAAPVRKKLSIVGNHGRTKV